MARRRPRVVRSGREVRVEVRRAQTTALTALRVLHARHERATFALREGALDPKVPLETLFEISCRNRSEDREKELTSFSADDTELVSLVAFL